jgi:hypothetical protein
VEEGGDECIGARGLPADGTGDDGTSCVDLVGPAGMLRLGVGLRALWVLHAASAKTAAARDRAASLRPIVLGLEQPMSGLKVWNGIICLASHGGVSCAVHVHPPGRPA